MTRSPGVERGDTRTDARHHARRLESEDVARAGGRWVEALALEQIGAIDARSGDTNHDLTVAGFRVAALLDVQLLGTARRCDDDRAQRSAALVSRSGGQETWPASEEMPTGPVHTGPSPAVLENAANGSCQSPSPSEYEALYPVFLTWTTSPGMLKL